jgi:hemoglobin
MGANMSIMKTGLRLASFALLSILVACASAPSTPPTLYDQLGGKGGIEAITDGFLANLANDARIAHFFAKTDIDHFRSMLNQQFCHVSGGPCEYGGKSMLEAHKDRNISDADFNALVEDLEKAMDDLHVDQAVQNRFLAQLVPMHSDIVYH